MSGGWTLTRVSLSGFAAAAILLATLSPAAAEGQWVEAPRQGWVDLSVYHLNTRDAFPVDGEVRAFNPFTEGHAVSTAVFVTVALGLFEGVDAWVQAPYQRLRFDDLGGERLRSGLGDTRLFLRVQPLRYFGSGLPLAIRGGVKVPAGDFAVESEIIPLGDGQRDWELMLELGHSFYPFPAYVSGWVGHRWREPNVEAARDFGDEVFFLVSAGAERGRLRPERGSRGLGRRSSGHRAHSRAQRFSFDGSTHPDRQRVRGSGGGQGRGAGPPEREKPPCRQCARDRLLYPLGALNQ